MVFTYYKLYNQKILTRFDKIMIYFMDDETLPCHILTFFLQKILDKKRSFVLCTILHIKVHLFTQWYRNKKFLNSLVFIWHFLCLFFLNFLSPFS
ncbi:hypothetical protein GDO81_012381 [Engystomops pustulosus]|uniref:Maturase K n=1 Tax=Engystomops pustulosus TaxID=76066 RepID=A0AAV7BLK8_ENGPU|nr:hypothetical protein GDO81_012381 [Engystomops pustulosus]